MQIDKPYKEEALIDITKMKPSSFEKEASSKIKKPIVNSYN